VQPAAVWNATRNSGWDVWMASTASVWAKSATLPMTSGIPATMAMSVGCWWRCTSSQTAMLAKYEGDRRALGQRGRRQFLGQERHSKEEIVQTEWQATQELDDRRGRERERRH
jgi:hypothetical protein